MARITKELTDFQITFINAYFETNFNGRLSILKLKPYLTNESAEQIASRMLKELKVKQAIELKHEELRIKSDIRLEFLVSTLKDEIYEIIQESNMYDVDGRLVGRKDRANLNKSIDLLAKLGGFYTQKTEIISNIPKEINVEIVLPIKDNDNK